MEDNVNKVPRTMLHTFLSVFIIFYIVYGIEGFGVIPEEIFVRVNEAFKISCHVPRANGALNFYDGDELVPETYIKRINDTFIEMSQASARPVKKNFTCKQDRNNVGLAEVLIDDEMSPVNGFKCRTSNLTDILCSFTKPTSSAPIKYRFLYAFDDETKLVSQLKQDGMGGYTAKVKVPQHTGRMSSMPFKVTLAASNKLRFKLDQDFDMKVMEILKPNAVKDLRVKSKLTTSDSVIATFLLPKELAEVAQAMLFDVHLRLANNETSEWVKISNPHLDMSGAEIFLGIHQLAYANTNYTIKTRMRSKIAADDEMWSPFSEVTFQTSPKNPQILPQTCPNCFNVMDNGNVAVYWTAVPKLYHNANNFSYLVIGRDRHGEEKIHSLTEETSLVLRNDSLESDMKLELYSKNDEGISEKFSEVFIPLKRTNKKLLKIRKELVDLEYKISWKLREAVDVESFTIIWCHQRNELPNQCDDAINIQSLPSSANELILDASTSRHFGIAANLRNKSALHGFEWAECTAAKSNEIGQVHSLWSTINGENAITLHWKLNCVDEPIVVGYNVTYCLLDDTDLNNCSESPQSEVVILSDDDEMHQLEISGLKSYRLYNVSVALMSHTRLGIPKAPITVRTMEGAPTAPKNLRKLEIHQHSIDLAWERPFEVNGEAMTYQLWYNDQKININDNNTMNATFNYRLGNLEAFTNYTITIVACTSDCSVSSDSLTLRTAMGEPGMMFQPNLKYFDEDNIKISWDAPKVVGGNLDYFQLKLVHTTDLSAKDRVYRVNGKARSCIMKGYNCEKEKVLFIIRSVNVEHEASMVLDVDSHNRTVDCFAFPEPIHGEVSGQFYGEWSQSVIHFCYQRLSMLWVAAFVLTAVSLVISIFIFVRLYRKYQDMKDIEVVWPKGLDPNEPRLSPLKDSHEGLKDLDLLKDHVLTDIEEEDEVNERERFIQDSSTPEIVSINIQVDDQRESSRSEIFLPFICNPKTNEIIYQMPKMASAKDKIRSAPTSPQKGSSSYIEFAKQPTPEIPIGYTKMYAPQCSRAESSNSVEGYLDMSGKPSIPEKKEPVLERPLKVDKLAMEPERGSYTLNDIKLFIQDSELNNNGYIGKRASLLMDPNQKRPPIINSNGYVSLQPK